MSVDQWPRDEPPAPVPDLTQLRLLAADAADRAAAMLAGTDPAAGTGPAAEAGPAASTGPAAEAGPAASTGPAAGAGDPAAEAGDPLIDAVRILATPRGAPHAARAARLTGLPEEELRQLVLAYRHGGAAGVSAAVGASASEPGQLADAVRDVRMQRALALGELAVGPGTITDPGLGVRIRLGPDGRWYPFTKAQDRWWPAPGPAGAPGAACRPRYGPDPCDAREDDDLPRSGPDDGQRRIHARYVVRVAGDHGMPALSGADHHMDVDHVVVAAACAQ